MSSVCTFSMNIDSLVTAHIILVKDGQILLQLVDDWDEHSFETKPSQWSLLKCFVPAGVEPLEELYRSVFEQTGIKLRTVKTLETIRHTVGQKNFESHLFFCDTFDASFLTQIEGQVFLFFKEADLTVIEIDEFTKRQLDSHFNKSKL